MSIAFFQLIVSPEFFVIFICCRFQSELTGILLESRVVAETGTRSSGGNVEPGKWKEIQVPMVAFICDQM